jgi:hypothetical protein
MIDFLNRASAFVYHPVVSLLLGVALVFFGAVMSGDGKSMGAVGGGIALAIGGGAFIVAGAKQN